MADVVPPVCSRSRGGSLGDRGLKCARPPTHGRRPTPKSAAAPPGPVRSHAVIPVARNVWQHVEGGGVDDAVNVYHDLASGVRDDRPGLDSCLRALRKDDVLVVWKLDHLGRNLAHLVNTVQDLSARGALRVLAGDGAQIDTTTAAGRIVFGIFAALTEFERELIRERTVAGLEAARARGRKGGRKFALSKAQVRLAQSAMAHRDTSVSELCRELGIRPVTLYRYVGPQGQLRKQGRKVLGS